MNNIVSYILKHDIKSLIMQILLIIICEITLGIIVKNVEIYNNDKKSSVSAITNDNEYRITDSMVTSESLTGYFADPNKLNNLKNFYIALANNKNYIYLDKTCQGIYIQNTLETNIFLEGYEQGDENYFDDESGNRYELFKNVTINAATQSYYDFKVIDGRNFESTDFTYNNNTIPVMIGYDYKDYYKVGDTFTGEYLSCNFNYQVIGILDKNTLINIQDEIMVLDRYIVSPSIIVPNAPQTKEELFYQSTSYMQKIHGSVILSEEFGLSEFTYMLENLKNTYSMFDFYIINESMLKIAFFQLACYAGVDNLVLFSCIIILLLTILDICFIINKLSRISYFCGINVLNGCKTNHLLLVIVIHFLFIHLLGSIIAFCVLTYYGMSSTYLLCLVLLWNIVGLFISMYISKKSLYKL